MKRIVPFIIAGLIVLAGALYLLRGVPDDRIPHPQARQTDTLGGYSGRPIPYNEVLLAYRSWFDVKIIVYNDLNDVLSDEEFDALDLEAIKEETGASFVIPNGRRYWVLDKIESYREAPKRKLGNHEFLVPAYVSLSLWELMSREPYIPTRVDRDTIYTYFAGSKVYRLIDPNGKVYTMQSATRAIDKTQTIDQLDSLGGKLDLPEGWQFRVDILDEDLVLASGGRTEVLQDNFQNTYQRNVED
ncbi:hypothetical protein P7228_07505 [Altererythrobacter arenosus]|uniref:Uncharacterized protein n=1 Tax=Altererythrobacter arenosus TaxID=3032592 RepID=A0ABY8FV71_9SPHN|nr:hypothetical protein [Altererythrobacter sp. CAU 1644]WFL78900.1 hypothetical protein P7228_07505 [Altererythrobacter sp. CAU 1644]